MPLNWQPDEEVEKHMKEAMEDERKNPDPEPDSGPATPSVTVEKEEPKPEVKAEEQPKPEVKDRPRNPDGTFAKTKAEEDEEKKAAEAKIEKPAEKPVEKPSTPPEGYVAHGAFHEERERRKALQKQVEAMEKRWTELVAKAQEKPAQAPDPQQDFAGYTMHQFQQVQQQNQELGKKVQSFEEWQQNQQNEQKFVSAYQQAASDFAARQQDFPKAYSHWLQSRIEELTDAGYTKEQALTIRSAEEKALVIKAFEDGVNPAERIFAVAKRRGYTAPSAETPSQPQQVVSPAEKLKQVAEGQRATPQMGGGGMKPKLTLQGIAQMSDEEFSSLDWEKTMRELTP